MAHEHPPLPPHYSCIEELAQLLALRKRVVFVTGAGLSAASGIPTFRGKGDAVWSKSTVAMGTRAAFYRNTHAWWNRFWLRHFPLSILDKPPNQGHEAIARLCSITESYVITQNVDGLHQRTVQQWAHQERLIEVHGRVGLYKCVSRKGSRKAKTCEYSSRTSIQQTQLAEATQRLLQNAQSLPKSLLPSCPSCKTPCMPQALMFDEAYESHSFYDIKRATQWIEDADAFVFVGTSFAVSVTSTVLQEAAERAVPVFNFNIVPGTYTAVKGAVDVPMREALGSAPDTLPMLLRRVEEVIAFQTDTGECCAMKHPRVIGGADALDTVSKRLCIRNSPEALPSSANTEDIESFCDDGSTTSATSSACMSPSVLENSTHSQSADQNDELPDTDKTDAGNIGLIMSNGRDTQEEERKCESRSYATILRSHKRKYAHPE